MTKRDYVKFAAMFCATFKALNESAAPDVCGLHAETAAVDTASLLMQKTADIFAADNPRFDRKRFYNACTTY